MGVLPICAFERSDCASAAAGKSTICVQGALQAFPCSFFAVLRIRCRVAYRAGPSQHIVIKTKKSPQKPGIWCHRSIFGVKNSPISFAFPLFIQEIAVSTPCAGVVVVWMGGTCTQRGAMCPVRKNLFWLKESLTNVLLLKYKEFSINRP